MSDPDTFIGHFNRAEAVIWFLVALGLPFFVKSRSRNQRVAVIAASLGFVLFGITDLLEAARVGKIPAWLWAFQPPFSRPLVFAAYFAEATKAKKATTGRPVRTIGSFRGLPQKAKS